MSDKFQNKYRIASTRLQSWHYGWDAAYFVTICTKERALHFGQVVADKMQLSRIGVIADVLWHEIKRHAQHVELDAFVVMPNHVHGVIILNQTGGEVCVNPFDGPQLDEAANDIDPVETRHALSLPRTGIDLGSRMA